MSRLRLRRLQRAAGKVLLHGSALAGILIDTVEKSGHDAEPEEQAQAAVPRYSLTAGHVLEQGDNEKRTARHIGSRLENLPASGFHGRYRITAEPHVEHEIEHGGKIKSYIFL